MYRDALGAYSNPNCVNDMYNDDDIIYSNSLIYPNTLIRMNGLLLFVRIARKSPPFVFNFLSQTIFGEKSWATCLENDLAWLAVSDKSRACAPFSLDQWVGFLRSRPGSANAIRKFCTSPCANVSTHKDAIRVVGLSHTHFCELCSFGCDSDQQLAVHMLKHHGVKGSIRLYVNGTRCRICLTEFLAARGAVKPYSSGPHPLQKAGCTARPSPDY